MRGAYRKGHEAAEAGESSGSCPYNDTRKLDGRLTWSRAFAKAWHDGWEAGDEQRKQDILTTYLTEKSRPGQPQAHS